MPGFAYAGISIDEDVFHVAVRNGGDFFYSGRVTSDKVKMKKDIFSYLRKHASLNGLKIVAAGFSGKWISRDLTMDAWLKEDMVPYVFEQPPSQIGKDQALWIAEEVAGNFDENGIVELKLGENRRVRTVRLGGIGDFRKISDRKEFSRLEYYADKFREMDGKLVFFSSTPRGGGVALMRHALIRLFRLLGIDADWYVMRAKKEVFEITKKKFHNVLQAVAPHGVELEGNDKKIFEKWSSDNAKEFEDIFKKATVAVIDDPQPSGMIPYLKKTNPKMKIIYRSHIQLETELMDTPGTVQYRTWNYLWSNIRNADLFVSHPVEKFIPRNAPLSKTVLLGASTDKLDGLNKKLSKKQIAYYLAVFNDILEKHGQKPLDLKRPYITQIARFDPSKGIPDVIESYRRFRKKLHEEGIADKDMPQLVIAGHGSVDDPEAAPIYNEVMNILKLDTFKKYADDIKVARLPHSDQILNAIMRGAFVALQLSHKEGFEVKVSEALDKGIPVIAYKTGGIPLQIEHGVTGYLVKVGDTKVVAKHLHGLFKDRESYARISANAQELVSKEHFTISNAIKWLFLATKLMENGFVAGNRRYVRDLIDENEKMEQIVNVPVATQNVLDAN
ncbi:MAG: Glycosyl transferase group 1 [Candidatus Moranbacteria bacterium GW2011_GWE1_49_15]|nr:MAG: Glycosyl transferase group 1 [Candidatus Moranbacteria bacterium GW2011_GWE1_49_15]